MATVVCFSSSRNGALLELEEKLTSLIKEAAGHKQAPSNEQLVVIAALTESYTAQHEQVLGHAPPYHPLRKRKKFLEYVRGRMSPEAGRRISV